MKQTKNQIKAKYIWKNYGLYFNEYEALLKEGCEICHRKTGRLCVDHIHIKEHKKLKPEEKGHYTRGILCFLCNVALRGFERTKDGKRNREQLEGTYKYFQKYRLKGEE